MFAKLFRTLASILLILAGLGTALVGLISKEYELMLMFPLMLFCSFTLISKKL